MLPLQGWQRGEGARLHSQRPGAVVISLWVLEPPPWARGWEVDGISCLLTPPSLPSSFPLARPGSETDWEMGSSWHRAEQARSRGECENQEREDQRDTLTSFAWKDFFSIKMCAHQDLILQVNRNEICFAPAVDLTDGSIFLYVCQIIYINKRSGYRRPWSRFPPPGLKRTFPSLGGVLVANSWCLQAPPLPRVGEVRLQPVKDWGEQIKVSSPPLPTPGLLSKVFPELEGPLESAKASGTDRSQENVHRAWGFWMEGKEHKFTRMGPLLKAEDQAPWEDPGAVLTWCSGSTMRGPLLPPCPQWRTTVWTAMVNGVTRVQETQKCELARGTAVEGRKPQVSMLLTT